ncbi:response regulator [Deinococcus yavapaiensis]|uniref:Response regulator receiver domain-containing protein n=1 Tax=Deinococcus yavapaiensis KR-236 TaxID=694435 RepID=A0A318S1Z1_9DEIO|nr:response regulator [Deinococcus yavapaiensis]PYE51946.1 response regulator receiver domain-containing protein [Deinococcus yavapaiensis KR-236]
MLANAPLILCIEDSATDADLLREAFAQIALTCKPVVLNVEHDGTHALDVAKRVQPDLILLDLVMPASDGLHVLEALKSDKETRAIPVIVLTHHCDDERIAQAYRRYANAFLYKGQSFEELTRAVGSLCRFWLRSVVLPTHRSGASMN